MVDETVIEEEKQKAKAEAKAAEERLRQKLRQPGASFRYEATPSIVYDSMPPAWGEGLRI